MLVAWAPLAVLSALQGLALRPNGRESFLLDLSAYGRYVVAAPVFVYAGAETLPRMAGVVRQFVDAGLIHDTDRERYGALVASTRRLLLTSWADAAIVVLAYVAAAAGSPYLSPARVSTWVAPVSHGTIARLSVAGWWRTIVSQPLLYTLTGIWLWRLLLWMRFLRQTARIDLRLNAAHPDLLGGLRFTLMPLRGFALLAFGLGAVEAGSVAESVLIDGQPLSAFRFVIGAQVLAVLVLFAGPLLVWVAPLVRLQALGMLHYGRLASQVGRAFQQRWLAADRDLGTEALEASDFSATTDLYSVVANVMKIKWYVLDTRALATLAAATLLPYVPLLLAVMPLEEILRLALRSFT
jgi:hypothetical protein